MKKVWTVMLTVVITVVVVLAGLFVWGLVMVLNKDKGTTTPTPTTAIVTTAAVTGSAAADKVYGSAATGFTINYAPSWIYQNPNDYTVVFSGAQGTAEYNTTVSIQKLGNKDNGGIYATTTEVVAGLKKQFTDNATGVEFSDEGNSSYTNPSGVKLSAKEFTVKYTMNGATSKEHAVIVPSADGKVFFVWIYTTAETTFDKYLPVARAMLGSWVITQ